MSMLTIKNIRERISKIISKDNTLYNITAKCIVKKVSLYPYLTYVDVCDVDNMQITITATIHANHYVIPIHINDVIIMTGDITFQKTLTLKVQKYSIDKPQISNYEKIMNKLSKENLLNNKPIIPNIITNIGIISSVNAAGLKDCLDILYECNLKNIFIYPVTLQGSNMEQSVINGINKANQHNSCDIILLIRGGGSRTDLEWFDNYNIAKSVVHSKIPIICGIGHEIDHSVMDVVCAKSFNTPTHVATYIRDKNLEITNIMQNANKIISSKFSSLTHQLSKIEKCVDGMLNRECKNAMYKCDGKLNKLQSSISYINSAINHHNKNYQKLLDNNNKNLLNTKLKDIIAYIDDVLTVSIYNKTTNSKIISKNELQICYNNNEDLVIKFMDGEVNLRNLC